MSALANPLPLSAYNSTVLEFGLGRVNGPRLPEVFLFAAISGPRRSAGNAFSKMNRIAPIKNFPPSGNLHAKHVRENDPEHAKFSASAKLEYLNLEYKN